MVNNNTVMENGKCIECGASQIDWLSCYEMFQFPLVWEHNDPKLYALHFWLVSCYMIQHPSNFTKDGYHQLVNLFIEAYDGEWDTDYILIKNREMVGNITNITNPTANEKRERTYRKWSITIEDIYKGGEVNAIDSINNWKEKIRINLNVC
ncbi:DUF5946 family protein [Alkalihalophilus pseudofirmus]|uniref:DUF5946 family protein n=1 Tax=Alkalihalophilus pseudofirmus TaxID=79885 RepID=UPI00259BA16A|nr:DUF5946 family protein [Alkalihalophilus pseudofirmus]WEG18944.1 DUF5946 family protein [Alkalihalophilus pseudofirmus]